MKKLLLSISALPLLCLQSCERSITGDTSIELASPKPVVTTELATATVIWPAIPKAAGYAYALDASTEYVQIEIVDMPLVLRQLAKGSHTIHVMAAGDGDRTMDSAVRSVDFEIDPSLPSPVPSARAGGAPGVMIVSWEAVDGATGYRYRVNDQAEVSVDPQTLSVAISDMASGVDYNFSIIALGALPDSEDSPERTIALLDTSQGVWIIQENAEKPINLTQTSAPAIYAATVESAAVDSFEILVDGVSYGFTSFSGNGGVGTVIDPNATMFASTSSNYYVSESMGRMGAAAPEARINKFWVNAAQPCDLFVKIDRTGTQPLYHIEIIEQDDASILLSQDFDLMTLGGNWLTGKSGKRGELTNATMTDGTDPGTATATAATVGMSIESHTAATAAYIANRELAGWEILNCYEMAGNIRLSSPGTGTLTTPKFEKLTAATTITLTFDAVQFGSATNNIPVKVLGAGSISSAEVHIKGASSATTISPEADGTSILMTNVHCPSFANADPKTYSTFTIVIEGATDQTQISWDATGIAPVGNGRMCLDNIVVKQ
jgi:hypothetical protein